MLWVLSTIVVGLVSFGYGKFDDRLKSDSKRRDELRRADAEIASRIDHMDGRLLPPARPTFDELRNEIARAYSGEQGGLYADYRATDIQSLATFVAFSLTTAKEKSEVMTARSAMKQLGDLAVAPRPNEAASQAALVSRAQSLLQAMELSRWRLREIADEKP
jgi:ribosomal protein S14